MTLQTEYNKTRQNERDEDWPRVTLKCGVTNAKRGKCPIKKGEIYEDGCFWELMWTGLTGFGNTDATGNLYKRNVREAGRADSQTRLNKENMKELGKWYTKPSNSFGGLAEREMRQ